MKNKVNQKLISLFILIAVVTSVVLFSRPKQAEAFWGATWLTDVFTGGTMTATGVSAGNETVQTGFAIKDFAKDVLKQIVMTIEKRLLAQMTKSTINWINKGFHGSPLFVENPNSFFRDIAKSEIKNFIDTTG